MTSVNLIGEVFGLLTVEAAVNRPRRRVWSCRCTCGQVVEITTGNLKNGSYKSCGCTRAEARRNAPLQHGHNRGGRRSKEYRAWAHMRGRCQNQNDRAYDRYGARGIKVCDRWDASFESFLADMREAPSPSHSIDRINNDGDYEPGNCRWAVRSEQARNTSRTIRIDGVCLKDVCAERGLSYGAVQMRLRRGLPVDLALSTLRGHAFRRLLNG